MVDRIMLALLTVACLALLGLTIAASARAHSPAGPACAHHHLHRQGEVEHLAKKAWRKPNGPGKGQRRYYRHTLNCSPHRHNIKRIWKKAKHKYAPLRERKQLWRKCGDSPIRAVNACIDYAARYADGDGAWMHRVAYCESRKNPRASNGSHHGLFQYAPSTWGTTPYGSRSIWSARWQSMATAWMLNQGRAGEWACG